VDDIVISEKKLEDYVYDHLTGERESENLMEELSVFPLDEVFKQFNLGKYGIPDIVQFQYLNNYPEINIKIFELKKDIIDISTFLQVLGYKKGILEYLKKTGYTDLDRDFDLKVSIECILIGRSIKKDDNFCYLPSCFDGISVYTYDIDIDSGLTIEDQNGFYRIDAHPTTDFEFVINCFEYKIHDFICSMEKGL